MNNLDLARLNLAKEILRQDLPVIPDKDITEAWTQATIVIRTNADNLPLQTALMNLSGEINFPTTALECLVGATTFDEELEGYDTKFKVEVIADSSGQWAGNGIEHDTVDLAIEAAKDLMLRWTSVREWRVVDLKGIECARQDHC